LLKTHTKKRKTKKLYEPEISGLLGFRYNEK
jgi:hypothetical protein